MITCWASRLFAIFLILVFSVCSFAVNGIECGPSLTRLAENQPAPEIRNPIDLWLTWEVTENNPVYRGPDTWILLPTSMIPRSDVKVQVGLGVPEETVAHFVAKEKVAWPKHPFNTASTVPHFDTPVEFQWPAHATASRSTVVWAPGQKLLGIKMPTNFIHEYRMESKTSMKADIQGGVERSNLVTRRDREIGTDEGLIILKDILAVSTRKSGNGYLVRDLSPLQDGFYYLPAFSIPHVGVEIAKKNGTTDYKEFWKKHYAEVVGAAKAKLLLRYGLQLTTPNAQNWLIQLDKDMRPTGRIVLRDVNDSSLVEFVAEEVGLHKEIDNDRNHGWPIEDYLKPFASNSFWQFDEAKAFGSADIKAFELAHDKAYMDTVNSMLKTDISLPKKIVQPSGYTGKNSNIINRVEGYLKSDPGRESMRRFRSLAKYKQVSTNSQPLSP